MLTDFDPTQRTTLMSGGINLACLGLLTWGVTSESPSGLSARALAALLLLVASVLGWLLWRVTLARPMPRLTVASLLLIALAGGALGAFAGTAVVFTGVAALVATMHWSPGRALAIAAVGPLSLLLACVGAGSKLSVVIAGVAATLAGALVGISRRQAIDSATRSTQIVLTEARADAEAARAELLAGRNHLARELHDVLAHTLSALSLRLEALDAVMEEGERPEVREQLDATKRLVRDGLGEARRAVQVLREDTGSLEEQLGALTTERHATLHVEGPARPLSPDVSLALFRVAQEALTNAVKHAPGAAVEVRLGFDPARLTLAIENGPATSPPAPVLGASGAGFGLQGIRERVLLLGGRVDAGPTAGGWLVHAEVPV